MMKSIREVLSPLLIISYVLGLRLWNVEFLISGPLRPWFNVSYMLLCWLIYSFFLKVTITLYATKIFNFTDDLIEFWPDVLITLLSVIFGMYHNKKFNNCLKKLDIVDDTLLKIGITTDYHELHKKSMWLVLGWFTIAILLNSIQALCGIEFNFYDILLNMYFSFIRNFCSYFNLLNDLIIASILGYIRLKFDQVNGYLFNLSKDNKCEIKSRASQNPALFSHQYRFPKAPNNEWMTWILIHLHLELRRISYEINSIFEILMTFKMGSYFVCLAVDLQDIFNLIDDYVNYDKILCYIGTVFWIFLDIFSLFLYNYMCETVCAKANATGNLINRMPYFTYDIKIRENILQLLLQITQMPIRFYGIGLFQFGYKFLQGFTSSITTVLVLLVQRHINNQTSLDIKNDTI